RWLMKNGVYADHLKSVFPAYTHPSHAAMETGALPARSGIVYNQPKNSKGEWNWYYDSIKAPTIWAAFRKAGLTTAAVMWPNTVDGDITYNLSEIWDKDHPDDRATVVRQHARPKGIYEEIEMGATGRLDSTSMNDEYFTLDENAGRMAAYLIRKHRPAFLALHFACVDGMEHEYGREPDSVRLALEADDRAIGDVLQAIFQSGLRDSTTVIVLGDHGFSDIHEVFRPNILLGALHAHFIAAGGSAFLYGDSGLGRVDSSVVKQVVRELDKLPEEKRRLFRIVDRSELDAMGADSSAMLALAAVPGLVFSSAVKKAQVTNNGPGTSIQQNPLEGVFFRTRGGHHGYDPNLQEMYTGFIAFGAGVLSHSHIEGLSEPDIAPLIAALLGVEFKCPDGKLVRGILKD
ncbi:MAG: alkaline phosphatase family protein, partial [Bacteroidota bacterium]|nr:alkaline phosphatase family protein [Bacteroidota bacterium]